MTSHRKKEETEKITLNVARLANSAFEYIPNALLRYLEKSKLNFGVYDTLTDNGVAILQFFFDNSMNGLHLYGSARELAENLKIYRNFPLSHKMFNLPDSEAFVMNPVKYRSLSGKLFYLKSDFISYLYSITYGKYQKQGYEFPSDLRQCFENIEKSISESHEFFRYEETRFVEIAEKIERLMLNKIENSTKSDVELLRNLLETHPGCLKPFSESNKTGIVVRIFEDGVERFVMKSELCKFGILKACKKNCLINLNDVYEKYSDKIDKIEFIRIPILRAKHAAVPIVTSSGDLCILAVDGLIEVLRLSIFIWQPFQRIKNDTWHILEKYMSLLEMTFIPDEKDKYTITLSELKTIKKETDEFWYHNENRPVKAIRDVGDDGFLLSKLKEELHYLGIYDLFPEVMDYAKDVYSEIVKRKRKPILRTCDLMDALEMCLHICIFNRFPNLKKFLHNQKSCHRIAFLNCKSCLEEAATTRIKYTDTEWKEYTCPQMCLKLCLNGNPDIDYIMDFLDDVVVRPNLKSFPEAERQRGNIKFFLIDEKDLEWIAEYVETPGFFPCLNVDVKFESFVLNLDEFSKNCRNKRIYIRVMTSDPVKQLFADEILEIIPILLRQQGNPIAYSDERLEEYRRKWKIDKKCAYKTISMDEFKSVLEEFDIDKRRVTIVPDVVYERTINDMSINPSVCYIYVIGPNGKPVMDVHQAVFYIFQSTVFGLNWTLECCKKHANCKNELKKKIIELMNKYKSMNETTYVTCEEVDQDIKTILEHCTVQLQKKLNLPAYENVSFQPTSEVSLAFYYNISDAYGFSKILYRAGFQCTPVWFYRAAYIAAWTDSFFSVENDLELHRLVRKLALLRFRADIIHKEKEALQTILDLEFIGNADQIAPQKKTPVIYGGKDGLEGLRELAKTDSTAKFVYEKMTAREEAKKALEVVEEEYVTAEEDAKDEEEVEKELKNAVIEHQKMLREKEKEIEHLKSAFLDSEKKAMKSKQTIEEQLLVFENLQKNAVEDCERIEKQEKRANEFEQKMKEMQKELKGKNKEIEQLKKKNSEVASRKSEEIEKMKKANMKLANRKDEEIEKMKKQQAQEINQQKMEIEQLKQNSLSEMKQMSARINEKEAAETKMKLENKELIKKIRNLEESVEETQRRMTAKLNGMRNEISERDKFIKVLQESSDQLTSEKDTVNKEFQNKIYQISSHHEEQGRMIQSLLKSINPSFSVVEEEPKRPSPLRCQLLGLQKIKDTLYLNSPLKLALEMKEKLISLSIQPEIHQMATYEYQQYEGKLRNYQQEVEKKIQLLKKSESDDVTGLPSLPDFPSFSDRFIQEYWLEIDKQKTSGELQDSECLFCFIEMKSEEKTLKCEHCRKITHLECASKWLKIHRSCPHCRREQLDPNEFPTLQ